MDLHELIGRRILPADCGNVRMENPSQFPVGSLDLLTGGFHRDAKDLIETGAGRRFGEAEVRGRPRSFGGGVNGGDAGLTAADAGGGWGEVPPGETRRRAEQ